jgi:hypothetical protein
MKNMFDNVSSLETSLLGWDISSVTNMKNMFSARTYFLKEVLKIQENKFNKIEVYYSNTNIVKLIYIGNKNKEDIINLDDYLILKEKIRKKTILGKLNKF